MPADIRCYALGGLRIASELRLPDLSVEADTNGRPADWHVRLAPGRARSVARWFHHWDDVRGRRWLSFGRVADGYLLRFARSAAFRVSLNSRVITCEGAAAVPADTLRHLLLNQVLPLAMGTERLVLHASAVVTPSGAVAFAGAGGLGKSTLAAALARRGYPLLADDALSLEDRGGHWFGHPASSSVRLWHDSVAAVLGAEIPTRRTAHYTRKRLVGGHGVLPWAARPVPLALICALERAPSPGRGIVTRRLGPRDALISLLPCAFQLDVKAASRVLESMERVAALVERVPACALAYPRSYTTLTNLLDAVERQVGSRSPHLT